jgi:hypothetical protein
MGAFLLVVLAIRQIVSSVSRGDFLLAINLTAGDTLP